jgi:hypothetical protein
MDDQDARVLADIAVYGCHVIHVLEEGDLPPFSYSVGITRASSAPEVIVVGLKRELAHFIVNEYNARVRQGERFNAGAFYPDFLEGFDVTFEQVDRRHYREHFGANLRLYDGDGFEVLQLVYPTTSGVWPWDPGAPESFQAWQPLLTASGGREAG